MSEPESRTADREVLSVSIVVCFHNHVEMTRRCLDHVQQNSPTGLYEIILVDDCSTDAAAQTLASIPGVRYIRTPENLGFTLAANEGARHAQGRYVLFLNNDTEVQGGWLDALLDAASDGPDVGAVGARLVYPDGRLQEAGGLIWSDATGVNVGRGQDPSDSAFTYRREVDYCSGACLLVRRDLFEGFGRFDPSFAPGFYEDTDLCFQVRQNGKVVLYEPDAVVVHHEGATFGDESAPGISTAFDKTAMWRNRHRFRAKWASELLHHRPPGTAGGLRGGRMPDRPRVLVCDAELCAPDRDSGGLRMAWLVRILHELGCEVTLFPLDRTEREPYAGWLRQGGIEVHCGTAGLEQLGQQRPDLFDVVLLSRPSVAATLRDVARRWFPRALVIYDAVDLHFVREERSMELHGATDQATHELRRRRRRELDEIHAADVVATITEVEENLVEQLVPGTRTVLLPNVHETRRGPIPDDVDRSGLLFIGNFKHPPNADAISWFVTDILPLLSTDVTPTLTILGAQQQGVLEDLAHAHLHWPGYVPDVTPYFDGARVFVAPLRFGAGMKGKIGMAMALGLPVVTTPVGAEGMGLVDGTHALIADSEEDFAAAVAHLQKDDELWRHLAAEARALAAQHWSPEKMRDRLHDVLALAVPADRLRPRTWGLASPAEPIVRRSRSGSGHF
jgi:GT2 family glycosyltransferase